MSKSSGGGGLKGHDKGGGGGVKVVKKNAGLESALEQVPDAFLCPGGHRMKLHGGSRKEGPLTCDGDDDVCCGRDGDGVLYPGDPRYSCEQCDFDICESCVESETAEELTPEQKREAARQRLREKTGRGGGSRKPPTASAAVDVTGTADDEAAKIEAKRAAVAAQVAAAKAAMAAKESAPSDAELRAAIEAGSLEGLKAALQTHAAKASAEVLAEARKAKDRLHAKAKKAAQKARRADGTVADGKSEAEAEATTAADAANTAAPIASFTFQSDSASVPAPPADAGAFKFAPLSPSAPAEAPASPDLPAPTPASPAPKVAFKFDFCAEPSPVTPPAKPSVAEDESDESDEEGTVGTDGLLKPPPNPLVCPLTREIFSDPVVIADGHTFERKAVAKCAHTPHVHKLAWPCTDNVMWACRRTCLRAWVFSMRVDVCRMGAPPVGTSRHTTRRR